MVMFNLVKLLCDILSRWRVFYAKLICFTLLFRAMKSFNV